MALKIIVAPALGDVAQGVAGLFGGGLQALGFSPDSKLLLVRGVYSDSAYPLLASRTAFWVYDIKLDQYSACVNKLITGDRPIEVSDVAIASFNGQTQLIASYRDTGATALNLNKLALIRNGVLVNSDLASLVSGNQADAMVDAIRVSANGRFVAIETAASNLTAELDTNGLKDIFLFDLVLNTSRRITTINGAESGFDSLLGDILVGTDGSLSVAFESAQVFTTQDSNGSNDVFVWRLLESEFAVAGAGTISLGSRSVNGAAGGNSPQLNSKGLVFNSESGAFSNSDLNNVNDVWQSTGSAVELVSVGGSGTLSGPSSLASSSDLGRVVAVVTASPEIAGQTGVEQLAIVNTVTRSTLIVSKSVSGALADDAVITPVLSGDGTWVAFSSLAGNLGAGQADGEMHLYVVDLNNKGVVTLAGVPTQGQTLIASVSDADGTTGLITYQWTADSTVVGRVTTATLLLTQAEVGKTIGVIASYLDDNGRLETAISGFTSSVANVNDLPTGAVTISGTATNGSTLSIANTLADIDGLGTMGYQWQSSANGSTDWRVIENATNNTINLGPGSLGKHVRAVATYTDGQGTAETAVSQSVLETTNVVLQAYTWKAHTLLSGVSLSAAGTSHSSTSDASGAASFTSVTDTTLSLTASRAIPSAEATATSAAVNLQDAIAILKMIVGLEVNGTGKALSPYQALAADYDGNGLVQLTDAIGVLKHVVGLTAPDPVWRFVNELDTTVPSKTTLSPGVAQTSITASLSASSPVRVGLVGYLTGDVDGSYALGGSSSLTKTYFDTLVAAHPTELSLAQFGVY